MLTRLAGYGIKSMWPIFKTEMLIFQSKANFNEKSLFTIWTKKLGKRWQEACLGRTRIPHSILAHDFFVHIKYYDIGSFYYILNNDATLQDSGMGAKISQSQHHPCTTCSRI